MKKATPIVSVITATYNNIKNRRLNFLKECIESVHAQTYPYIEHLVIDNVSNDGTLEFIREYESKGWLKCLSEPDKGIYDAFNKGIEQAHGKYIVFLNSDDYWTDNYGVSQVVSFLEQTGADFAYSKHVRVDESGNIISYDYPRLGAFFSTMPICHQTMFTKKSVLLEHKFDSNYKIAADFHQLTEILLSGKKPVYVPIAFTAFRQGGVSTLNVNHSTSMSERQKMREALWYPILGKSASETMFKSGIVPDDFLQTIAAFVHPIVAHEISQCLARVANKFRTISTYTRKLVQENKTINWGPALNIDNDVISFMVHLQYKKILWQYYTSKLLRACSPNKAKRKYYAEKAQRIKHLIQRKRQLDKYFKNIFS